MLFGERRRYNGQVVQLLEPLGLRVDADPMSILAVLDDAWSRQMSEHEAALLVAYSHAAALYGRGDTRADHFTFTKLYPTQLEWLASRAVRASVIEPLTAALKKRAYDAYDAHGAAQVAGAPSQLGRTNGLTAGYAERVRELRRRVSDGSLPRVETSTRVAGESRYGSLSSPECSADAARLEATQTWWPEDVGNSRFVLTCMHITNATARVLQKLHVELWDVDTNEVPRNRILFEITPDRPLPAGDQVVLRFDMRVPWDHPVRHRTVNACIVDVK